jgi:hypothetical protein
MEREATHLLCCVGVTLYIKGGIQGGGKGTFVDFLVAMVLFVAQQQQPTTKKVL